MNGDSSNIASLLVSDLLGCWPQTIPVFGRRRMACVGCAMAAFFTVADVAAVYAVNLDEFLAELGQAIHDSSVRR